jgi:hypothetical protein
MCADLVLKKTMVAMTAVYSQFFKVCQENKILSNNLDPLFMTQSLMGILHHFMRTEATRERLLSHKKLKHIDSRKIMVENILTLLVGNK